MFPFVLMPCTCVYGSVSYDPATNTLSKSEAEEEEEAMIINDKVIGGVGILLLPPSV